MIQTHQEFLRQRSLTLMPCPQEPWVTRACLMFRCQNSADGEELITAIQTLSAGEKDVLQREFSATGFDRDSAILLYYDPAMLDNLRKAVSRTEFFKLTSSTAHFAPARYRI